MNQNGRVAVLSAIPQELALLVAELEHREETGLVGRPAHTGRLDGIDVVLAEAGIGKVNTAVAATLLVERHAARVILFTGVAGGLDPNLNIGDVVVAEHTLQHDTGLLEDRGLRRYQPGHIPFFNPTDRFGYDPPAELLERVKARLRGLSLPPLSGEAGGLGRPPHIWFGTVLTGDVFLNSEVDRERLHAELGGAAVEMEGAALAQAAEALGVGHLVVRSLTDLAGADSIRDFGRFLDEVAANSARVVRHVMPVL